MTTTAISVICTTAVKIACLGGMFALAYVYDGTMLYLFAALAGGVAGYDLSKIIQMRRK